MRRIAVGVLALAITSSACSLGPREEWAESIHGANRAVEQAGTARARMSMEVKVIETVIRLAPKPLVARLGGVVDFDQKKTRLIGADKSRSVLYFDDLVAYLPRSKGSLEAGRATQKWASFDFGSEPSTELDDNDRRLAVGAGVISPPLAIEMLQGVLTGSVEEVADETVGDASTTHYRGRLSKDAAAREIDDEDRREGVLRLLETLGQQEDVFPVEVWLDSQQLPRRIEFVLRQQKDRVNAFKLTLAWEFSDYGAPAEIKFPTAAGTLEKGRFRDFIVEFIREQV